MPQIIHSAKGASSYTIFSVEMENHRTENVESADRLHLKARVSVLLRLEGNTLISAPPVDDYLSGIKEASDTQYFVRTPS